VKSLILTLTNHNEHEWDGLNEQLMPCGSLLLVHGSWFRNLTDSVLIEKIQAFMEDEARSCSMDYGCVTPEYVFRMWGGSVSPEDECG
jgi:hypothetical protein